MKSDVDKSRVSRIVAVLTIALGLIALIVVVITGVVQNQSKVNDDLQVQRLEYEKQAVESRKALAEMQVRLNAAQAALADASKLNLKPGQVPEQSKLLIQIDMLRQSVADIKKIVDQVKSNNDKLSQALEADPEKALSVPLLRKDLEDVKNTSQHDLEALRNDVAQMYDTIKWLIGLIAAGLIGTAVSNMFQTRRSSQQNNAS